MGESEREALAASPRFHAEVEREVAEAKLGRVRSEAVNREARSERGAYAEALRRRADLVLSLGPESFVREERPAPGIPAFRCVPFFPTFTEAPLPPMVALTADLLMFSLTPGAILSLLLKRSATIPSRCNVGTGYAEKR